MQIVNKPIIDLDGNQLINGEAKLDVATVLVNCALTAPAEGAKPRTGPEVAERFELAMRINKMPVGESFDVTPELMIQLKDDLLRIYATIVSGQMQPIMDGKVTH